MKKYLWMSSAAVVSGPLRVKSKTNQPAVQILRINTVLKESIKYSLILADVEEARRQVLTARANVVGSMFYLELIF